MSSQLSPSASRAKYLYNKKYQDAYWERRAQREAQGEVSKAVVKKSRKRVVTDEKTTLEEICHLRAFKAGLTDSLGEPMRCCINREEYIGKDEKYIEALECSNKTLNSENRRLINLLTAYQRIIKIGINSIYSEAKIKGDML